MGAADCRRDGRVVNAPSGQPPSPNDGAGSALTAFQVDVAQLFFALPASDGFLLAGGAALSLAAPRWPVEVQPDGSNARTTTTPLAGFTPRKRSG